MANLCTICGLNLDMVGRSHRCVPKSSYAGVAQPVEHLSSKQVVAGSSPAPRSKSGRSRPKSSDCSRESGPATASGSGPLPKPIGNEEACSAIEPSDRAARDGRQKELKRAAGVTTGQSDSIRRGRPRIGETRDKPWIAAGMSERTWYRRKREKK